METSLIRLEGLSKRFGAMLALDDVSLEIAAGEMFALLGGSGCGKSTLLRLIAGLEVPSAGRVRIDGSDITDWPAHRRPVNMMFQTYALFPHMSVAGNVAFGLKQEGLPGREIRARVADMLALVELADLAGRRPHQLSGGQRQRVALARCLVKQPKVLLLDEPLAALDKALRERTQGELKRIQAQVGITFIVVTHDQGEAMALAGRMAVMDRGRIVQVGRPSEVYRRPRNRFVAEFIGHMNLFAGRIESVDGGIARVRCPPFDHRLKAPVGDAGAAAPGDACWIGVRPERIRIASEANQANAVSAAVDGIADLGERAVLSARLDDGTPVRVSLRDGEGVSGGRVRLAWRAEDAVLLAR